MENIKNVIMEILCELHPDKEFENCSTLVDSKVLDSFDIISLVSELNDEFDIVISAEKIIPENFNSVDAMAKMVSELADED